MTAISAPATAPDFGELEDYRCELTGYCYRMLGSPFDAEDAVQDSYVRAWRSLDRFEGRSTLRPWLYRIATNVCLDMLRTRRRRVRPMDLGPAAEPLESNLRMPDIPWIEPIPVAMIASEPDPAEVALTNESIRLAFVAALQQLPARQRAALILCEVLDWRAAEAAVLLGTTVASVNSALQRARATLAKSGVDRDAKPRPLSDAEREMLGRFVSAFERYDIEVLADLLRADACQSMPPFDMWLSGRRDLLAWWFGPGITCKGSRLVPAPSANGLPTYGQYKPSKNGGYEPWSLMTIGVSDGQVAETTFFLDTARLFPLFGLAPRLKA